MLRFQPIADDGDIVAAEIVGFDTVATLKRYSIHGNEVALKPESSDPQYNEMDYPLSSVNTPSGFYIRGIAVAVLKSIS
jgi:SOS-response transcriptional repressor LexA